MDHLTLSLNIAWTLLCGFLVMFMQAGFALVETGLVRAKNVAHSMSMNFLVYALAIAGFFVCGFAFMCGGVSADPHGGAMAIGGPAGLGGMPNLDHMLYIHLFGKPLGLLGFKGFFLNRFAEDPGVLAWFFFMMVFLDTAATIPTGALLERWRFKSFALFSLVVAAFIYPVYGCWMWGGGWLAQLGQNFGLGHGAVDFAGSSVVHLQGGAMALVCTWMLGPRIGKYDLYGQPRPILGHHIPMVMLGTFILAFGWFGFNCGSSLSAGNPRLSLIAVNTMLASAAGTLASTMFMWIRYAKPDPSMMCNGMLAGLVAITASCAYVDPWAAFLIGAVAGLLSDWSVFFWERRRIDDPVGAISVHAVGGIWGMLALGIFANGSYGMGLNGVGGESPGHMGHGVTGLLYGDFHQFIAQLIAVVAALAWTLVAAGLAFKLIGRNRVSLEVEVAGLDIPEMGAPGYPEFITSTAPEMISPSQIREIEGR